MQDAGRILLMPKGDYSASATYEMLDLVNHNGASWVCKKECTGQEPSDSNTEYWQRFGTAVDLSNYLPKTGGTVEGNLKVKTSEDTYRVFTLENGTRTLEFAVYAGGTFRIQDVTNNKNIMASTADGTNTFNGTASGNLPLTGGKLKKANADTPLDIESDLTSAWVSFKDGNGNKINIGIDNGVPSIYKSGVGNKALLHTGNKPSGTYTGNGSATERTIATGSSFPYYIISSSNGILIVTPDGCFGSDGTTTIRDSRAYSSGSNIVVKSSSPLLNAEGVTYKYLTL